MMLLCIPTLKAIEGMDAMSESELAGKRLGEVKLLLETHADEVA